MANTLDFERIPSEAEIRKLRRAYYLMVPAYLMLLLAIFTMIAADWEGGPETLLETSLFVLAVTGTVMGYQLYVGSFACPRCGRRFLGQGMAMKPRLIEIADPRCAWCGFSLRARMAYAIDSKGRRA
jgi:hypothetical protein